ncbi:MAG TPA: hypothetical protein VGQ31_09620 [Candidatus Limnocylindrales bacterium]|nr:hypothetical protein [Candidatus Limnocylindrales bacterium]
MTRSDHDPILEAFDRHLAAVERLVPAVRPALVGQAERKPIKVVAGTAVRRGQGPGSGRRRNLVLVPIGVVAVVLAAVVGVGLMTGPVDVPGGVASPSPAAVGGCPSPSGSGTPPITGPCRYTAALQPRVEIQIPPGWTIATDSVAELSLRAPIAGSGSREVGTLTIGALDNVAVDTCVAPGDAGKTRPWAPATPAEGPQDLMSWIDNGSGIPHSPPAPVTIDGRAGLQTDVSPGIGSLRSCGGIGFLAKLGADDRSLRVGENEAIRLAAIEVDGRTIVVATHVPRAVLLDAFAATADPIVRSISFR